MSGRVGVPTVVSMWESVPNLAGTLATVVFAGSTLPMLRKAVRSRDLASYSTSQLVLANVGNALYSVYVFHLPPGPIWALHGFYLLGELDLAQARYEATGLEPAAALARYERGEVLRIRGEHDAATVAYDAAAAHGCDPQPGLALLWLARGRTAAAVRIVRRLVDETRDPVRRSRLLPAAVEIMLAAGEADAARAAADELDAIAAGFGTAELGARAAYARGTVALAEPDPAAALRSLREACAVWLELGARYDAARARARIGLALRALGDEDSAGAELAVAQRTFGELGALPAQREIDRLLGSRFPDGLTGREVEVLRLVAAGHGNQQIAAMLFLSEKTVARHLSNIFGKVGVSTRTAAAAYAFEHGLAS